MSRRLFILPRWQGNPYLTSLYLAAQAAGWRLDGAVTHAGFLDKQASLGAGDVLHVHWTAVVTQQAESREDAERCVREFAETLEDLQRRGVRLLWTVHNEIAHDAGHPDLEAEIAELLVAHADRIIVLHDRTPAAVAASYALPTEKVVVLRHASYRGIYDESVTAAEARERLGVPADAPTVGLIGQLRPYKGIDVLLAAADRARETLPDLTVLLAGRTPIAQIPVIDGLIPPSLRMVRRHEVVPDDELGLWLRASNVIALPYRRILNSGSLLLAATFGRPVILPSDTPLVDVYAGQAWVDSFDADDAVESLAAALIRTAPGDRAREASAQAFATDYTPYDMSRDFLRLVEEL